MFDFIKKKIKDSINTIQKKLSKEEEKEILEDEKKEEKILQQDKVELKKDILPEDKKEINEEIKEIKKEVSELKNEEKLEKKVEEKQQKVPAKKKSILSHAITEEDVEMIYSEIKSALLENNVALSVLEGIEKELKARLVGQSVSVFGNKKYVENAIKESIAGVLIAYDKEKFISDIKSKKPFVILIIGVNGAGKTTTIAKLCKFFLSNGLK
ncbi:MAG: signal recognition particle receptor subunit alpha, partial [Candidatus Parvarchaeota archaeon]|nr:signal recognition particle receptor subunit alpha [Candidatus Parvarchaeum tengchongense]